MTRRRGPTAQACVLIVCGLLALVAARGAPALGASSPAELVTFTSGRTLPIAGHRYVKDQVVLELPGGGEMWCDSRLIHAVEAREPRSQDPSYRRAAVGSTAARRFEPLIEQAAEVHGVSVHLIHAVITVESAYNPAAVSPKGAMGLMQLMPATASHYEVQNPLDAEENINAGTRHLRSLLDRFDVAEALAAYNAGIGSVLKFGGIPPFPETIGYVRRVTDLLHLAQ